ncbi:hypothetical protein DMB92_07955 [Campylobacter sp. MIT 99-7217]|uniref:DUF6056 family protein n=1 Tax=Campylobacter sp. MIT 99-7217 TaxID=535091 RepID=UPI00115717F6|nr:DUF6056 family protein [Campylobacter sp. MIT 99-7217]TQR29529.1 hypothetical protein DMB92_07955 [Campylobacter sp. MIT 99-7217]
MKNKKNIILFLAVFAVLFVFNFLVVAQSDDWAHYFTAINPNIPWYDTYFTWNARIGEILNTGFLASLHQNLFDILNALVGSSFIFAVFYLCFLRLPKNKLDLLCFLLLCIFFIFLNSFSATFLWGAGSLNYLWGVSLIIWFLIPFRKFFHDRKNLEHENFSFLSLIFAVFFMFFGVLAGMASELMGATICLLLFISFIYAFIKKISLRIWYVLGSLGFFVGYALLFFAPANKVRGAVIKELDSKFLFLSDLLDLSFFELVTRINKMTRGFYDTTFLIFMITLVFFYLLKKNIKLKMYQYFLSIPFFIVARNIAKGVCGILVYLSLWYLCFKLTKINKKYFIFVILFGSWILMSFMLIQVYHLPSRARFGDHLILFMLILFMFREIYLKTKIKIWIQRLIYASLGILLMIYFANYSYLFYKWKKMEHFIAEQKAMGIKDIVVSKETFKSFIRNDWANPSENKDEFPNPTYAKYFEVESFIAK